MCISGIFREFCQKHTENATNFWHRIRVVTRHRSDVTPLSSMFSSLAAHKCDVKVTQILAISKSHVLGRNGENRRGNFVDVPHNHAEMLGMWGKN